MTTYGSDGFIISQNSKKYDFVYDKLINHRTIFLTQEIDEQVASSIIGALLYLNNESDQPINFYINSPGGLVDSSYGIYDMMQYIKAPVKTICCGEACSFGAILLAAGSKGMRCAMPNATIMIHQVQIGNFDGSGTDLAKEAKNIEYLKKRMTTTLAQHTGQPYDRVYADCEQDTYMTAQQALMYGIIDQILIPTKEIPKAKKRRTKKA